MNNKCFTIQEIMTMKFYELPNVIYNAILADLQKLFRVITDRMLNVLNNAPLYQIGSILRYL